MVKENRPAKKYLSIALVALALLVIFVVVVMFLNSRKPPYHSLEGADKQVKGAHFVRINQALIKDMSENWLPNDIFWPTVFLDNMPNFQIGVLEVVRYNTRVLRDNLSRMRTTDKLDFSVEAAFTALSNDPYKWWFPSAESKWRIAHARLTAYYKDLARGNSHFSPRADNLVELLNQYLSLMGGVNTRLVNAPRDIKKTLSVEVEKGKTGSPATVIIDIPWHKIDDNFYYAQGVAYALYESFRAIRIDFAEVLSDKNSVQLADKVLEVLARCQFEPLIVFNGNPDSIFANHSLNLSGVFNDARQKMNSLTVALMQG